MSNMVNVIKEVVILGHTFNIYGTYDNPMFLAKDVAEWIKHSNYRTMVQSVDDDEKGVRNAYTPGGNQQVTLLTEFGVYEVLMQSRLPIAKQFKKEVKKLLHEIRTTGSYNPQPAQPSLTSEQLAFVEGCQRLLRINDVSTLRLMNHIGKRLEMPAVEYVPSRGITHSAKELLKMNGYSNSVQWFNKLAVQHGFLEEKTRPNSKGGKTPFKSITEKGLHYGENLVNPASPLQTQPHWYDDKFKELMSILTSQLTIESFNENSNDNEEAIIISEE